MVAELYTTSGKSAITYRVINPSDISLPIEVEVYKRSFDEDMKEVLEPSEEDFIVLPPQIEVPANGYQVFRAQYIGDGDFDTTQSYRIVFKQLPLQSEQNQSQVNMIFNFATLVFVSPPDTKGELTQNLSCDENQSCHLHIENTGNQVVNLVQSSIKMNDEVKGDWQWLQKQIPVTFLMPKHKLQVPLNDIIDNPQSQQGVKLVTANNAQ
ncbi:MAG: fimbria/pilus periplasmic chaperone [Aestuariibacter sp.]